MRCVFDFFFFNDTATTEIYTLSLHDALPISMPLIACSTSTALRTVGDKRRVVTVVAWSFIRLLLFVLLAALVCEQDRKSTRLNSSHANISYAVFCLKKNKKQSLVSVRTARCR